VGRNDARDFPEGTPFDGDRFLKLQDTNAGKFGKEILSRMRKPDRLTVTITLLFFFITTGWILFEHAFLPWTPVNKDFFWAILSAGALYLLLQYGIAVIRRSEAALKESEDRVTRILETSTSGILVVDRMGDITYANLEAAAILGARRSDIVGRHYRNGPWEITTLDGKPYPDEDLPFSRVGRTGEASYGVELALKRRDGTRVILSINSAPLLDAGGNPAGMIASFFDITSKKEAEEFHIWKLSLAIEQSPSAIMITDRNYRIEYVNQGFTRMTGYAPEEILGETASSECEHPAGICDTDCGVVISEGKRKVEREGKKKTGEPFWESISISPIRDRSGAVTNYLWIREDVTERKRSESAVREGRERYQDLVEKIHDLVWETDSEAFFTYVSPRIRGLLGYDPDEVVGKNVFDLMPESEARRVRELAAPILAGRLPFEHVETTVPHKNGAHVDFTTSGAPSFGADGSFRGWRGVSRDITMLKKDKEALRRSEERFRQIFEQNEEPVFFFRSGTAEIIDANPAALSLYGYSLEEMKEGGLSLFASPGEQFRFEQEIRGIQPGNPLLVEEARHIRKDGTPIIVSIRGKSILLKEGQISYCTFRDITARVRAEEEARARQAQLIHANRMTSLGTMVSGVAHEINNPNNLIMFNAPMIKAAWADADKILEEYRRENGDFSLGGLPYSEMRKVVPRLIAGLSESSVRIRTIVEKLKHFARRDKENLECGIDLNEVIRASVSILNHEIVKSCRDFRVDLEENLPLVKGCAQQLEQVMVNLVLNALEALPEKTRGIHVATLVNAETGMVEVRVRDEGIGMSAEVRKRISEPFFSTKLESGGLGLGLSISSSIVREHNGTLDFESEVGKGTTARLSFPSIDSARELSPKVFVPKCAR
jgi:PAS domain S-box-containing protein